MKIHFVCGNIYPHTTGGMEVFNYYFIRELSSKHQVSYSAYRDAKIEKATFFHLHKWRPQHLFFPLHIFIHFYQLPKDTLIVYSYSEASGLIWFFNAFFAKLFNLKYIIINHWGATPNWKFSFPFRYFFKNSHKNIAVSEDISKNYYLKYGIKFEIIPPLIPFFKTNQLEKDILLSYNLPEDAFVLSFIGSLKPMKNPNIVLKAFALLGIEYIKTNNLHLIFAGEGVLKKELEQWCFENNLSNYIHFLGIIKKENIPEILKITKIYIISSDYEGTSVSLLEAMFNKLSIIGSDSVGINNMIVHGFSGLLYPVYDDKKLAENIHFLVPDKALRIKLGENAHAFYQNNYIYEDFIKKYEKIINLEE
ncbi:MAG: glycosyltransferase family 4 protein [Bacteroidota bacterium]|nr:glycosyltransferase family 4 protein [Bacteroidota bacterium]